MNEIMYDRFQVISLNIHHLTFNDCVDRVSRWGLSHDSRFVCFANAHMVIEAYNDPLFRKQVNEASLVLPDGKPVALACRWLYKKKQERISGMDFMPAILERARQLKASVFLYGSTQEVLEKIVSRIHKDFPGLIVAGTISPPFRALTSEERKEDVRKINESGAHFVLVALGCPKQEKWMADNYRDIKAVLLGLGGAFPVMAGLQKRAPRWMQNLALEWLYRFLQEPGRLFKRYFYTNFQFIRLFLISFLTRRFSGKHTSTS